MDAATLDHLQVGHSDTMHTETWRIAIVLILAARYEGCSSHGKENTMNTPTAGDTGTERERIIMEPIEVPSTVPAEEPVPA